MSSDVDPKANERASAGDKEDKHVIHYFVDNVEQFTAERSLTVEQILKNFGLDPATHYLVEIKGHNQIPHKDLNEEIKLHENQRFITVFTGPTPVS